MNTVPEIDPTIEADTYPVHKTAYSHIRLMNDCRWPWLIVLPRDTEAKELHHLDKIQRSAYLHDINQLSEIIQQYTACSSVNIAMLGNVVSALHCHLVARHASDLNWPKPIWGFEKAVAYNNNLPDGLIRKIQDQLTHLSATNAQE